MTAVGKDWPQDWLTDWPNNGDISPRMEAARVSLAVLWRWEAKEETEQPRWIRYCFISTQTIYLFHFKSFQISNFHVYYFVCLVMKVFARLVSKLFSRPIIRWRMYQSYSNKHSIVLRYLMHMLDLIKMPPLYFTWYYHRCVCIRVVIMKHYLIPSPSLPSTYLKVHYHYSFSLPWREEELSMFTPRRLTLNLPLASWTCPCQAPDSYLACVAPRR